MGTTTSAARRSRPIPPDLLTPKQVAKILGVTNARVVALDAQLDPSRNDLGHRRYRRDVVEKVRAERAARKRKAGR